MIYFSCRTFYIKLKETWLYERDSDAPSVSSEPGGKYWQHHIRGWRNYGVSCVSSKFYWIMFCRCHCNPVCNIMIHVYLPQVITIPDFKCGECIKLDMSTARWRLKSPRSLSGTSAHLSMVTRVNLMVMNGWLTSFTFMNQPPHSWDKAISDSDLETPRSRSWVWSKGKVIQSAQYHINSLPFHFTSIRPTIPEIELFRNLTLKHPRSRSWVRSKVKVIYCTQCPTNAIPFRFTSIGPTIPEIWPK